MTASCNFTTEEPDMKKPSLASLIALALLVSTPAAHAQFAVIDVASVTQLLAEVQTLAAAAADRAQSAQPGPG